MGAQASGEDRIPVDDQVLRSDRGCDIAATADEIGSFSGRYVLEDDLQSWKILDEL